MVNHEHEVLRPGAIGQSLPSDSETHIPSRKSWL